MYKNAALYICICLTSVVLLFFAGCAKKEQAVQLYVDAVTLREFNENQKAIGKLNSAVKINNRFSLAYSLLGEIYQDMKDYEKSAASYEKATELNPWSFRDYFNLGRVYQLMKEFAQAVKAYARACDLEPEHLEAHINTSKCYYEIKDYNNALVYGQRAEKIDPNVSEIQKVLGDIYESQKDHDQAIRYYKRSLEMDSNSPEIMTSLALVYLRTNRTEPAQELLASAIKIQPDSNTAYQYLGYCYLLLYNQALESYKSSQQADTDQVNITPSMTENLEKAVESYGRSIQIDDKDWKAHKGLGVAYTYMFRASDNKDVTLRDKAVEQLRLSLEIKPDQPNREMLLKLIQSYSTQNQ